MVKKLLPVIVVSAMMVVSSAVAVTFFYLGKEFAEKERREQVQALREQNLEADHLHRLWKQGKAALVVFGTEDNGLKVGVRTPIWDVRKNAVQVCLISHSPSKDWCGYLRH